MNHPSRHALTCLSILALIASFLHTEDAEAGPQNRSPRYRRSVNSTQCESYSWKPTAKSIPGGHGANDRVPFMTAQVHAYLAALNSQGCGLSVQSTYRDCVVNRNVGGVQKSRHLCGSGADTSGCPKRVAAQVCRQEGMTYIEEGSGKFPHCQVDAFCNKLGHD